MVLRFTQTLCKTVCSSLLAGVLAASLASCGSRSHSASLPQAAPSPNTAPTYSGPLANASFSITIPAPPKASSKARRPSYVSSSTTQIVFTLTGTTNAALNTQPKIDAFNASQLGSKPVTLGDTQCPGTGPWTCTIQISLPPGTDNLTVAAEDSSNKVLSQQKLTLVPVVGQANAVSMTLDANTGSITVTPPGTGVTLAGAGCPGSTISGSSDLSGSCTATFADGSAKNFTLSVADPHGTTIPSTAPGAPVLSASSSDTSKFTTSVSGSTLTITRVAAGTAKITVTSTPANLPSDGLAAVTLAFTAAAGQLYVSNALGSNIYLFAPPFSSGSTASSSIVGLSIPEFISIDSSGRLDVANNGTNQVLIYAQPITGASTPSITISNGVANPLSATTDSSGNLYVTDYSISSVRIYTAPLSNSSSPSVTITNGVNLPGYAVRGPDGNLYVANASTVQVYTPPFSNASTPSVTLASGVSNVQELAFDSSGKLYVANYDYNKILVYATPLTATSTPLAAMAYSKPLGLAFDSSGNLYATNNGGVSIFSPPFSNASTPTITFSASGSRGIAVYGF